jgi:hypothetical protein
MVWIGSRSPTRLFVFSIPLAMEPPSLRDDCHPLTYDPMMGRLQPTCRRNGGTRLDLAGERAQSSLSAGVKRQAKHRAGTPRHPLDPITGKEAEVHDEKQTPSPRLL